MMSDSKGNTVENGMFCKVVNGIQKGKTGTVEDLNISKTGHMTITVRQPDDVRFKTLARNVEVVL